MNILLLSLQKRGGGALDVLGVSDGLCANGFAHEVMISAYHEFEERFDDNDFRRVDRIATFEGGMASFLWSLVALRPVSFLRGVTKARPRVIHVLNFHPWIFFLYLARPFLKFKIIYSPQDNPFASKEAYQPVLNFLERAFVRRADAVIAYSTFVARALAAHVPGEVGVMYAGIYPQVYGIFKKEFSRTEALNVLFFGRIEPYKGVDILLKSYLLLKKKDRPVHLTIAGRGDLSVAFSQEALAAGVDLRNHWLSGDELGGLIKEADVIAAPYTDATQSGVVIAAISYLIPVIATRVGALPEYVRDGEGGFLVPPGDPAALAAAIERFMDDRGLAAEMSRRQEAVREAFSWKNVSQSAIVRYRSLLE